MDNEDIKDTNERQNALLNDKYLNLLDELEKDNPLGVITSINPDQQIDNDEILKSR